MGDDLLELAKAKELASVLGGAWHSEEWDADSDSEQSCRTKVCVCVCVCVSFSLSVEHDEVCRATATVAEAIQ